MMLVQYHDLSRISYQTAWDYQTYVHQKLLHNKLSFSKKSDFIPVNHLLICEHNHVYTLGKSGDEKNLLIDKESLEHENLEFFKINRGGDITYHGVGQLTVYPILDLELIERDVHKYVRNLEQIVINVISKYGIHGVRDPERTGVWIDDSKSEIDRKICAIGVHLSRWVSLHGFALNVNTNLDYFKNIIPCGIIEKNKTVTSIQEEIGKQANLAEIKTQILDEFSKVFNVEYINYE